MKSHPFANILPELDGEGLKNLAENIKNEGLKEEIVMLDGQILDGRNRFAACKLAKVEPRFRDFSAKKDGDPLRFVMSLNLHRRHLTDDQRAQAAAEFAAESERGRPAEVKEGETPKPTQAEAAELFGVPVSAVKRAAAVSKKGSSELKKAVKEGKVKLSKAAAVTKEPKPKQMKAATAKPAKRETPKEKLAAALDQLWLDNRENWNSHPACTPANMVKHFHKLIEKVL